MGELILRLGGKPLWRINTVQRVDDLTLLLRQQIEREKQALMMYQAARQMAELYVVKPPRLLGRMRGLLGSGPDMAPRSYTIGVLNHLAGQKQAHIRLAEDVLAAYLAQPKRQGKRETSES